jgi:ribosomal protein L29
MSSFKSLIETSSPKQKSDNKLASPKSSPNAADLLLMANKKPTAESERENAERVDALLMELFPERFEKQQQQQQKKGKGKGTKKAAAAALAAASGGAAAGLGIGAFNKNQVS